MPLEADVDLKRLAEMTEQFSGADLQALMYNAHLEVVHSTIAHTGDITPSSSTNAQDDEPIEYVQLGTPSGTGIRSRAEESALQKRVR
jgi:peroxin-1